MEEYKSLQDQIKDLQNFEREMKKKIEDYQTEIILNEKKVKAAIKKEKLYSEELEELKDDKKFDQLCQEYKAKKQQLKQLEAEESQLSNQLLPYLKFKTCTKNIKPTDFYDMIVHCSSILELLEHGWRIQFNRRYTKNNNLQELIDKFNKLSYQLGKFILRGERAFVVFQGIIGDANKGKSFFISQICAKRFRELNIETPTGMTVSTKGLSVIKHEFEKNRWLDILDSEGFHAPIQYEMKEVEKKLTEMEALDNELKELNEKFNEKHEEIDENQRKEWLAKLDNEECQYINDKQKDIVDRLQELNEKQLNKAKFQEEDSLKRQKKFNDRQVSEKLIQQYIIKSSSMIIVLVGDLTLNEQKRIEQIISSQESRPVIIVHNMFKILTYQELKEKIEININQSFQVQKQTYVNGFEYYQGMQKYQDIVKYREVYHIPFGYSANDELLAAIRNKSAEEFKEFSKIRELNDQALQFIEDKINFYYANISQLQKRSLTQSLKDHFTENITDYLDLSMDSANPDYSKNHEMFKNLKFDMKQEKNSKESLLLSNSLIALNNKKVVNLKYFNFDSNNQIVNQPGQSMQKYLLQFFFKSIHPKYSLFIQKASNTQKKIFVLIEMPPISEADIPEILKCSKITKGSYYYLKSNQYPSIDNDSYILRLQNFKRSKGKLFELFGLDQNTQLKLANYQASDTSRQYKIEGIVEIDIKLCLIRQMKVGIKLDQSNIEVTQGGVVKYTIDCEDLQKEEDLDDCYEDEYEEYLN